MKNFYTETCSSQEDVYPDENTPTRLFNGIPFRDLPICDIKASKNNTIISVSNAQGGSFIVSIRMCAAEFVIQNVMSSPPFAVPNGFNS
jgi:small subunit ribosomal protein S11